MTITGLQGVLARISEIEHRCQGLRRADFALALRAAEGAARNGITRAGGAASLEERTRRVQDYMRSRNFNPALAEEAETFVLAAERFGMDWRLAPALAAVESSGGRCCFRPYNPFGILGRNFRDFREAVYEVNRLVKSYGFGNDLRAILGKYNPSGGEGYIRKVLNEMSKM